MMKPLLKEAFFQLEGGVLPGGPFATPPVHFADEAPRLVNLQRVLRLACAILANLQKALREV